MTARVFIRRFRLFIILCPFISVATVKMCPIRVSLQWNGLHCSKNNLNLRIQAEPAIVEADPTLYVWFMGQIYDMYTYM